jgi:hypothetical protein
VRAYSCAKDATRAANSDADDASPAAVGKLLYDAMCTLYADSYSIIGEWMDGN